MERLWKAAHVVERYEARDDCIAYVERCVIVITNVIDAYAYDGV
jgi:hypothetical protein